jgi:hypothetical protein
VTARDSTGESVAVAGGTILVGAVTVVGASATDKTAPILAFVGAIVVALITAYKANRRQVLALNAESTRLTEQLRHERELADLASARTVLDDAALALHRVQGHVAHAAGSSGDVSRAQVTRVDEAVESQLKPALFRLIVRFGDAHPVVEAFNDALTAFLTRTAVGRRLSRPVDQGGLAPGQRGGALVEEAEALERVSRSPTSFLAVAAETTSVQLPLRNDEEQEDEESPA